MRLREVQLGNVRRFQGKTATLAGIADGVTTICAPNESGKSTFFDALHALFFIDHKSQAAEVKSLQPHAGGAVRISAEVEFDDGRFLVEKVFLSRKTAKVTEVATGRVLGMEGEAEAWIRSRIFQPAHGPAGLLWVRQGMSGFGPEGGGQKEKGERERLRDVRRDLMSSVAGQIDAVTGGRRMDAIMELSRAEFDKIATRQMKPKAGGPWAAQEKIVSDLSRERERLASQVEGLSQALVEKARLEAELGRERDPETAQRREEELVSVRRDLQAAQAHAEKIAQARRDLRLFDLEIENLDARLSGARQELTARRQASARIASLATEIAALEDDRKAAAEDVAAAREALKACTDERSRLSRALTLEHRRQRRLEAARQLTSLEHTLTRAEALEKEMSAPRRLLAGPGPTQDDLASLEELDRQVAAWDARRRQSAPSFEIAYLAGLRATDASGVQIEAGKRHEILHEETVEVSGQVRITLHPAASPERDGDRIEQARADLRAGLADLGVDDLDAARRNLRARQEAQRAIDANTAALSAMAPEGVQAMRGEAERLRAATGEAGDDAPPAAGQDCDTSQLEMELQRAEVEVTRAREVLDKCAEASAGLDRRMSGLEAEGSLEENALRQMSEETDVEARIADLEPSLDKKRQDRATQAGDIEEMSREAPATEILAANVERLEGAVRNAAAQCQRLEAEINRTEGVIRARAEDAVEEKLSEVEGRLEAARARAARFEREAVALGDLMEELETARRNAQDAYFEPVKREIAPLLRILHGNAQFEMDGDSMLLSTLVRGGVEDSLDVLSGGAFEQIAILTRLAFAQLYRRAGTHVPVILDDALVHSDDARIGTMFTLLTHVGRDQQIIVFSCRQRAFSDLGGARGEIRVSDLRE